MTSSRVIFKTGLFVTKTAELQLEALEAISVTQSFLEKVLGCGKLCFTGRGGSPAIFIYVDKPVRIKANVEHVIKQHRKDTSEGVN